MHVLETTHIQLPKRWSRKFYLCVWLCVVPLLRLVSTNIMYQIVQSPVNDSICSSVWECVMLLKFKEVSNICHIVFQKWHRNLESRFDVIDPGTLWSRTISLKNNLATCDAYDFLATKWRERSSSTCQLKKNQMLTPFGSKIGQSQNPQTNFPKLFQECTNPYSENSLQLSGK